MSNPYTRYDYHTAKLERLQKSGKSDKEICEELLDPEQYPKLEKHFIEQSICFPEIGPLFDRNEHGQFIDDPEDERGYYAADLLMAYLGITTYDGDISKSFAKRFIPVLEAIAVRNTFQFIGVSQSQEEDLILVASFLAKQDLVEWGTSIRGAHFCAPRGNADRKPGLASYSDSPSLNHDIDTIDLFICLVRFVRQHMGNSLG